MSIVTGLSVTVLTWFMIASPLLASLVSTSTTPASVRNTVVLLPAPLILYRLSLIFSILPVGGIAPPLPPPPPPRCCAAAPATAHATTTIAVRTFARLICSSPLSILSGDDTHGPYVEVGPLPGVQPRDLDGPILRNDDDVERQADDARLDSEALSVGNGESCGLGEQA